MTEKMMRTFGKFKAIFAKTVFILLFLTQSISAEEQKAVAVETSRVRSELVSPAIWVPGTVISRQDSRIAAEVSGNLVWVAEVGDRFKTGEILARINDRELQLELRNNRAAEKRLSARFDYLERQVKRLGRLAKSNSAAESELDQLSAERDMLTQELMAATVAIDRTLYDIERTRIAAPFAGVVVERMQQPGEYLARAGEVVRLVNTDVLEIRVQAPLNVARHVSAGDLVKVKSNLDMISTHVRTLIPVGDDNSRMLQLRLELENSKWIIGEAVRVALNNATATTTLTVPRDALVLRDGETYVFTVLKDQTARRIDVIAGEGADDYVSVKGGLSENDEIIIRGAERLRDGSPVKVTKTEVVQN